LSVGLVYDPIYLEHDTGQHVENAQRLVAIVEQLEEAKLTGQLVSLSPRAASLEELSTVHSMGFISYIQSFAEGGGGWLDADTVVSPTSYAAALYAAGGAVKAVDGVLSGEVESVFALVRPPGHHALRWEAMGFCLFNNIAIAAKHALNSYGLERILIVDFDVHHGNGTQDTFYNDSSVLYFSTHQYPFYPGSGHFEETGDGPGEGYTVNVSLPAWCGDSEYLQVFEEILAPVARRFSPQLILVSAGYDAHWSDHIALMRLSVTGFAQIVGIIKKLAQELCQGRIVLTLEGGYDLPSLASSVRATFDVLLGNQVVDPLGPPPQAGAPRSIDELLQAIKEIHNLG
jgi:acetoin utilization deacetylase AcuC-like enzyme